MYRSCSVKKYSRCFCEILASTLVHWWGDRFGGGLGAGENQAVRQSPSHSLPSPLSFSLSHLPLNLLLDLPQLELLLDQHQRLVQPLLRVQLLQDLYKLYVYDNEVVSAAIKRGELLQDLHKEGEGYMCMIMRWWLQQHGPLSSSSKQAFTSWSSAPSAVLSVAAKSASLKGSCTSTFWV